MNMPTRSVLLLALGLAAAPSILAEQSGVAKVTDLRGNVLMSTGSGLAAAPESARLTEGTRVITTNKAGATIVFDDGCRVTMKENQRFEVKADKPCEIRIAGLQSLLPGPAAPVVATTSVITPPAATISTGDLVTFSAFVGLGLLDTRRNSRSVSPS